MDDQKVEKEKKRDSRPDDQAEMARDNDDADHTPLHSLRKSLSSLWVPSNSKTSRTHY